MFKLPNKIPNFQDGVSDIADFFETECLKSKQGKVSFRKISVAAAHGDDEIEINGIEDDNDKFNSNTFDEVCAEIQRRSQACGGGYPFSLEDGGYMLKLEWPIGTPATLNYAYLLLATRLNMKDNRVHDGIDGALLFEKISAFVAQNYWGERSESMVFGTSNVGEFSKKVDELCARIGEGRGFLNRDNTSPDAQDDKLDIVVWKSFQDDNPSKLIGFGQCKTGTSWKDLTTQLHPDAFCKNWFHTMPVVDPVRLFFISDSFFVQKQFSKSTSAGVVFDRFRIIDFLPANLDEQLTDEVKKWVEAVLAFIKS